MKPTPEQRNVIASDEHDILVEAGAGSGKTWTTVQRYGRLVRDCGYLPREILAFTFTDKAAGELRERVRRELRDPDPEGWGGEPVDPGSVEEGWIGTFHAVCGRILRAYPIEAGVDPAFAVIDDVTAETLRAGAFADALESFAADGDADPFGSGDSRSRREALIGLLTERTLRETVFEMYDELRSRGIPSPALPNFPDTPWPRDGLRYLREHAPEAATVKGSSKGQREKIAGIIELLADPDREFRWEELSRFGFTSKREALAPFCEALSETVAALAQRQEGDFVRRCLGRLLERFGERFAGLKAARSLLDYEDLQLITLELLRDNHPIRDAYRDRFREIMVDEFQDTNRLQLDLIGELRGPETTLMTVGDEMQSIYGFRHAEVELFRQRRRDPQVTPYSLPANFRSRAAVTAAVNRIGLTLDRQVTARDGRDRAAGRHEFKPLTAGREEEDGRTGSVTVAVTGHDDWKPLDLGPLAPAIPPEEQVGKTQDHFHQAEALNLARHLRELVDSKVVRQGEIAILLRAKTRAGIYVDALRQVGLSPYLTAGRGLWESREAVDLKSLLSVIANPLEDETLLGALVSPACGISTDALWLLQRAAPDYRPLWPTVRALAGDEPPEGCEEEWLSRVPDEDREAVAAFTATIDRLRSLAPTLPLDVLIEETVTATGYDLACLIRDPSRNGAASLRRVGSLAREFELAEGRDLRAFLDWADLSAELDSESAATVQDESSEAIRIMTVHAAKGLQFGVVCVPDLGRSSSLNYRLLVRLGKPAPGAGPLDFEVGLSLPHLDGDPIRMYAWRELNEQAEVEGEDEELRLLHVAMTRAEDHLVLSGVLQPKYPGELKPSRPMISRIGEGFDLEPDSPEDWPGRIPAGPESDPVTAARPSGRGGEEEHGIVVTANFASEERAGLLRRTASPPGRKDGVGDGLPPIHRPKPRVFPNVPLSFTAISEFEECPAGFFARRVLRLPAPGDPDLPEGADGPEAPGMISREDATRFGSAVHDVLEDLGRRHWPALNDESLAAALRARGADPEVGLTRARTMITAFRESELGERVRRGQAGFELPLLVRISGITIRGFADVLVDGPPPLVLDYKTSRLGGEDPEAKMGSYIQQRNLYALAVARARRLDAVETAFVFLERPDEPVVTTMDGPALDRAEAALERSLEDIVAGRFFGGPEATRQPCGACDACSMLDARINPPG